MGVLAFGLLMVAELALSVIALDRSVAEDLATHRKIDAMIGRGAQLVFAVFPLISARLES